MTTTDEFMSSARDVMRVARRASYGRATEMIAQMLRGERERAARLVERHPEFLPLGEAEVERHGIFVRPTTRADLAAAIRRGEA